MVLLGAPDTGKTSFAKWLLEAAVAAGRTAAYVDAEIDQTTTGPPTCAGLHWVRDQADLENLARADAMKFVGSTSPEGMVLQQVVATASLVDAARQRADIVIVDTTGTVSGVIGQSLKYHKMELIRPDVVVGFQRGGELEPLVGMLRRFFTADVEMAPVSPAIHPASPDDRRSHRIKALKDAFTDPLQRWRVRPTVFAPTLPAGLDLKRLHGVLVGLTDGTGWCLGLGILEHEDGLLRVITNTGDGMRGLRLGSLIVDLDTFDVTRVRLREVMFGLD